MPPRTTLQLRLRPRDYDVLAALADHRLLSVPQLAVLHFPSRGSATARLRRLHQGGLVARVFMPVRPYDRRAHTIYGLAGRGARTLRERRGGELPRFLSTREQRSGLFLDHTLRRNDVRTCLELLARQDPGFQLLTWRQVPEEVRASAQVRVGRKQERVPLIPDGYFALRHVGTTEGFVLEIDMGTVLLSRMERRYRGYWTWWKARGHHRRFGKAPLRVLTLTTTTRRLQALKNAAARSPTGGSGSGLFWFARLDIADLEQPHRLLGPSWEVARPGSGTTNQLLLQ